MCKDPGGWYHAKSSKLFFGSPRLCRQHLGKESGSVCLGSCYPLDLCSRLLKATGTDRYPNFPLLDTSEVRRKKKESSLEGCSFLTSYPNWIWAQRLKTYSFPGNEEFCQDRPVERIGTRCLMLLMNSQLLEPRGKAERWASIPGTPMFALSRASPPECGKSLAALASG